MAEIKCAGNCENTVDTTEPRPEQVYVKEFLLALASRGDDGLVTSVVVRNSHFCCFRCFSDAVRNERDRYDSSV